MAVGEKRAAATYRMWSKKPLDESMEVETDFPTRMQRIGFASSILYASDKWEAKDDLVDYLHDFDSSPAVFIGDAQASGLEHDHEMATRTLMGPGVPRMRADVDLALPLLGFVKELIIHRSGPDLCWRFSDPPCMACSPDKKTLVILSADHGPILIRGGAMHVEGRGICR